MFLKSIELNNFVTSKVIDMKYMFSTSSLTSLNIKNFNTNNLKELKGMFSNSKYLSILELGNNFITSKVRDISELFKDCQT